jgi:nucleoside 2-deoxyribosyltransferase
MRVYLAGPLGFSEVGTVFHKEKIVATLTALKYEILDPWQLAPTAKIAEISKKPYGEPRRAAWEALNPEIGGTNAAAINSCDLVFAVLDGTDVDSGTASEIGYAFALGKKILGYRGDFRLSADNEGSIVNLQVEYFIKASGGEIFKHIVELPDALQRLGLSPSAVPGTAAPAPASTPKPDPKPHEPAPKSTAEQSGGAKLIIGILLALIVRAALEAMFKDPIQEENASWPTLLDWFQLLTFSVMMARFYLGATRYIDTQPPSQPLWVSAGNMIFASLLFGTFYVAGLAVAEEEFYPALLIMHLVDAGWFLFGFLALRILSPADQPGEIKVASNRKIMKTFFWLSVVTIAWAVLLFALNRCGYIGLAAGKFWFLAGLIGLSIFDFWKLQDYYFRNSQWIAQHTAA